MELNQLESFLVAAEEENITRAAARMYISQSALSRTIGRLEHELEVQLFDRSGKSVYLNDYGKTVYGYTKKLLELIEEMKLTVADMENGITGEVNVGYGISSNAPVWLDKTLALFFKSHPDVKFNLFQLNPQNMAEALENRKINIAITSHPEKRAEIIWKPMFSEEIGVLLSYQHRFASQPSVHLADLKEERFFLNNSNSDIAALTEKLCTDAGFSPNIFLRLDRPELIGEMIAENKGISFITKGGFDHASTVHLTTPFQAQRLIYRPLAEIQYRHQCYLGYLDRYQIKAVRDFIEIFRSVVAEYFPPEG